MILEMTPMTGTPLPAEDDVLAAGALPPERLHLPRALLEVLPNVHHAHLVILEQLPHQWHRLEKAGVQIYVILGCAVSVIF